METNNTMRTPLNSMPRGRVTHIDPLESLFPDGCIRALCVTNRLSLRKIGFEHGHGQAGLVCGAEFGSKHVSGVRSEAWRW